MRGELARVLPPWARLAAVAAGIFAPTYMAAALLLFGHHYITDIVGGGCVAFVCVAVLFALFDRLGGEAGR
jgi:membrane-associated phospholipid phosphatase